MKCAFDDAVKAWLSALTAFEIARRLVDEDDPQIKTLSAKIQAGIRRFELSRDRKLDCVSILCDQAELAAYYFPAGIPDLRAPSVICISREDETAVTLLGRLLPVVIDRGVSILVISHDDVSSHWRGQSEMLLSYCFDYLSDRPDVNARRIAVYGEGLSAILATEFAVSDRRVAAAVCDGGLWNFSRTLASVSWMTRTAGAVDEDTLSSRRSRVVRQLNCPVLVLTGGRGTVSLSEAIKLQTDCSAARVDLEISTPQTTSTSSGEVENFILSDDCIFGWLQQKLQAPHLLAD
ncbi:alpha/beta hydrolase family protein [Bradyrhizobium elkanii]|uniref:alpha/beta hydrolase family protein n=1 Tax=Bradyrhizobium elkanii TaxID=29448 RepID=UPI001BA5EC02|nr:hypothetical protein [Bradyrhizobium elkanii]MBR1165322.1 hypothetical protein [Bradyrhizobium elkanii]